MMILKQETFLKINKKIRMNEFPWFLRAQLTLGWRKTIHHSPIEGRKMNFEN